MDAYNNARVKDIGITHQNHHYFQKLTWCQILRVVGRKSSVPEERVFFYLDSLCDDVMSMFVSVVDD